MQLLSSIVAVLAMPLVLTAGDLPSNKQPTPDKPKPQVAQIQTPQPEIEQKFVSVNSGDTLIKIAKQHETTYPRLYSANPAIEHPDIIHPGDEIRIPKPDEQLAERSLPTPEPVKVVQTSQPQPRPAPVAKPNYAAGSTAWDSLARCESGGNWSINSGNGYYGGLQFTLSTWRSVGGSGYPHQASREEQIARAEILLARSGWGQWPACASKLDLL